MENKDKVIKLIKDQTIQLINETFTESEIKDNFMVSFFDLSIGKWDKPFQVVNK